MARHLTQLFAVLALVAACTGDATPDAASTTASTAASTTAAASPTTTQPTTTTTPPTTTTTEALVVAGPQCSEEGSGVGPGTLSFPTAGGLELTTEETLSFGRAPGEGPFAEFYGPTGSGAGFFFNGPLLGTYDSEAFAVGVSFESTDEAVDHLTSVPGTELGPLDGFGGRATGYRVDEPVAFGVGGEQSANLAGGSEAWIFDTERGPVMILTDGSDPARALVETIVPTMRLVDNPC